MLVNITVLTKKKKKKISFHEYCIEKHEKFILETMYFTVLFSVTNKTVNVKEEFCWTLISKKCDFNMPVQFFQLS